MTNTWYIFQFVLVYGVDKQVKQIQYKIAIHQHTYEMKIDLFYRPDESLVIYVNDNTPLPP